MLPADADPEAVLALAMVRRRKLWYRVSYASFLVLLIAASVRIAALPPGSAVGQALVLVLFVAALGAPAGVLTALAAELRCSRPAREQAEAIVHPRRTTGSALLSPDKQPQATGTALVIGLVIAALVELPVIVNSVGYAAGFGGTGQYTAQSYGEQCSRNSRTGQTTCTQVSYGTLTSAGHTTRATYDMTPPLGQPITVRSPVWDGWTGRPELVDGALAVFTLAVLLLGTYACEAGAVLAVWARRTSREDADTALAERMAEFQDKPEDEPAPEDEPVPEPGT